MTDRKHRPSVATDGGVVQTSEPKSISESSIGEEETSAAGESTVDTENRAGNQPVQQADPDKAIRLMYDVACEDDEDVDEGVICYFKHYVRNTDHPDLLRDYIEYEGSKECRRHRIGMVNQRLTQLKQNSDANNE